jgi:hypothetical protein
MPRSHRSIFFAGLLALCMSPPLAAATFTWDAWVRIFIPATNSTAMVFISASTYNGCTSQLNAYLYPPQTLPNPPLVLEYRVCARTWHSIGTLPK